MYRSLLSNAALLLSVVVVSFSIVEKSCVVVLPPPIDVGDTNDCTALLHNSSSNAMDGISDSFIVPGTRD